MKRILITGGAGFLGSHLCERLWNEGNEVICMDNFFTSSRSNIEPLIGNKRFEFIRHDVTVPYRVECDQIYNLACPAAPGHYQHNPIKTTLTAIMGTYNALELARHLRVPILQASTSEVYGDPEQHPQTEDYVGHVNPIGIRSCYDEGKRAAESLCFDFQRHEETDVRVARIFNTYGPRMHPFDGRVVSNFIREALVGNPLQLTGTGSQTRSFCYVSDLVDGLIRLMDVEENPNGPVNLGNPDERTIMDLAVMILEIIISESEIEKIELPEDDPSRRCPDISRAKSLLGWEPVVGIEEGLEYTIRWFRAINLSDYCPPSPRY